LPHPQASRLLTEKFCRACGLLPGTLTERALILAMVDPADVLAIDDVRLITGLEVRAAVTTAASIEHRRQASTAGRAGHLPHDEGSIDLCIASIPTIHGENVTVRLLDDRGAMVTLEQMGMVDQDPALFRRAIKRPWGEVLVTGPTGSGKCFR
jgi:Tfp pilus assembly pilus retraction ATPase PilT